jgi:hypothetical protein
VHVEVWPRAHAIAESDRQAIHQAVHAVLYVTPIIAHV